MKLYYISQSEVKGYDTYSALVVCAESEESARLIHPRQHLYDLYLGDGLRKMWQDSSWCSSPEHVKVEYLGEAADNIKRGIILESFHAG